VVGVKTVRGFLPVAGLILAIVGSGISGYLSFEHGREGNLICGIGHGCQVVAASSYAYLGPLPTASYGMFMYMLLTAVYGTRLILQPSAQVAHALRVGAAIVICTGTGVSAWLTYVELYILHAMCFWCVMSAVTITLLLIVATAELISRQQKPE
jgi:uncharacterized membrane protein